MFFCEKLCYCIVYKVVLFVFIFAGTFMIQCQLRCGHGEVAQVQDPCNVSNCCICSLWRVWTCPHLFYLRAHKKVPKCEEHGIRKY